MTGDATTVPLRTGGCHCGRVRFAVSGAPGDTVICRCTSCRRVSGALQVPWTTVARAAFRWTDGVPRERESSPGVWRAHCADCGTPLAWRRHDRPDELDLTTCSFDGVAAVPEPDCEIWGEDTPSWALRAAGLPVYARKEADELLFPAPAGLELRAVSFATHAAALLAVRIAVFVEEQGVPREVEADERDAEALHVLATAGGVPVATGRLDVHGGGPGAGKVGRVAVLKSWRGRGAGTAVMRQLHRFARHENLAQVWCHAQRSAVPFYERLGYRAEGNEFEEAGIAHRRMRATLAVLAS
jgi:predicted GNAT family N-acyltransferase